MKEYGAFILSQVFCPSRLDYRFGAVINLIDEKKYQVQVVSAGLSKFEAGSPATSKQDMASTPTVSATASARTQLHIIFFPYLNLIKGTEFDFGFLKIWQFDSFAATRITDDAVRAKIKRLLGMYHGFRGPLPGIAVASIGPIDFRPISESDQKAVNHARLILFLAFLSQNNTTERDSNSGHSMATSENFEFDHFRFVLDDDYFTESGGYIVNKWSGGIKIDSYTNKKPPYVLSPGLSAQRYRFDEELFHALLQLRHKKPRVFEKIISSIEIFYESYFNSPQVSGNARILLQASAFEMLLGSTITPGRETVKKFFKDHANTDGEKMLTYLSERGARKERETGSIKELWADRFFTLRNHIIHGDSVSPGEFIFRRSQRHIDAALVFFVYAVKKKIELSVGKEIFGDEVVWKTWTDDLEIPPKTYTNFVLGHGRGKMRRTFERFAKRLSRSSTP